MTGFLEHSATHVSVNDSRPKAERNNVRFFVPKCPVTKFISNNWGSRLRPHRTRECMEALLVAYAPHPTTPKSGAPELQTMILPSPFRSRRWGIVNCSNCTLAKKLISKCSRQASIGAVVELAIRAMGSMVPALRIRASKRPYFPIAAVTALDATWGDDLFSHTTIYLVEPCEPKQSNRLHISLDGR